MRVATFATAPMASATSRLVRVISSDHSPWRPASAAESPDNLAVRVAPTAMDRPRRLAASRMSRICPANWLKPSAMRRISSWVSSWMSREKSPAARVTVSWCSGRATER